MKAVLFLICLLHLAAAQRHNNNHGSYEQPAKQLCGAGGDMCCKGERCERGFVCDFFNKCKSCGERNDQCCDENICAAGLACSYDQTCLECGDEGQIPCPPCPCPCDDCDCERSDDCPECKPGYVESGGFCVKCGQTGIACCEPHFLGGPSCDYGNLCNSGECVSCGGLGEDCCEPDFNGAGPNSHYDPGCFESCCHAGKCRAPECVSDPGFVYEGGTDLKCSATDVIDEDWCEEFGEDIEDGITANEACCQCGGGQLTCAFPAVFEFMAIY